MKKEDLTDDDFNQILSFVDANYLELLSNSMGCEYLECRICNKSAWAGPQFVVHKETCLYHKMFIEKIETPKEETWGEKTVRLAKIAEEQRINLNNLMIKTQEKIINLPGIGTVPDPSLSMDGGEMAERENTMKRVKLPMCKAEEYLLDLFAGVDHVFDIVFITGMPEKKAREILDFVEELRKRL